MRLLGVDYGTKKVGIALSDEGGTMAFPHAVVPNDSQMPNVIAELVHEQNVQKIIIGRSHNLANEPNVVQREIDAFVQVLEETFDIPIMLEPEQFSTQAALRIQGRTKQTDASAAALILDGYIQKTTST